jgi:hypothetical protein
MRNYIASAQRLPEYCSKNRGLLTACVDTFRRREAIVLLFFGSARSSPCPRTARRGGEKSYSSNEDACAMSLYGLPDSSSFMVSTGFL